MLCAGCQGRVWRTGSLSSLCPISGTRLSDEIKNKFLKLKREKRAESCRGKSQDSVSGFCKILLVLTKALAPCPPL